MYNDKLTMRQVKAAGTPIIKVGYCDLQNLLKPLQRVGYCAGKYGWNCDVYRSSQYIISTGYRSFGDIKAPYDTCVKWERKAMEAMQAVGLTEREATAWKLLDGFCADVVKGWKQ